MDGPAFNRWFRGSPLERTRRKRVLRNVAIAMGNSGKQSFRQQLEAWAHGEDSVLAQTAHWALQRLQNADAIQARRAALTEGEAARLETALRGPLD